MPLAAIGGKIREEAGVGVGVGDALSFVVLLAFCERDELLENRVEFLQRGLLVQAEELRGRRRVEARENGEEHNSGKAPRVCGPSAHIGS